MRTDQFARLQRENDALRRRLIDSEANEKALHKQLQKANDDGDEARKSLPRKDSESRKQIETLTKERDDKQNQLRQSDDQMTKLNESLHKKESESMKQIETLRKERDDKQFQLRTSEDQITKLKERLSQSVSLRLRDNTPNIIDLSDKYRPSKLAEMMSELYDNQWTDAFTYLEDTWGHGNTFSETECIEFLLNVLMEINTFCLSKITNDWTDGLEKILLTAKPNDEAEVVKMLKDIRKKNALTQIPNVEKMCVIVLQNTELAEDSSFSKHLLQDKLYEYLKECVKLCLLMAVQDPPVCLVCDGWKTRQTNKGENSCPPADSTSDIIQNGTVEKRKEFDRGSYKEYTKRGQFIEYIVWPLIYLHDNGPILSKGVAQGCDTSTIPPHDDL